MSDNDYDYSVFWFAPNIPAHLDSFRPIVPETPLQLFVEGVFSEEIASGECSGRCRRRRTRLNNIRPEFYCTVTVANL